MSPDAHGAHVRNLGRARAETQVRRARSHLMRSVPEISHTHRPASPATCTWSSSLISMKAGTLMAKAGCGRRSAPEPRRPEKGAVPHGVAHNRFRVSQLGRITWAEPAVLLPPCRPLLLVSASAPPWLPETLPSPRELRWVGLK